MAGVVLLMLVAMTTTLDLAYGKKVFEYTTTMDYSCPANQVLSYLHSTDSFFYNDRKWTLDCKNVSVTNCQWDENFKSGYEELWQFECKNGGIIAGVKSQYYRHDDRLYEFRCCQQNFVCSQLKTEDCEWTDYLNNFENDLSYTVPADYVIAGVRSWYTKWFQ